MKEQESTIEVFNRDAASHEGYLYTKTDRLSCTLATQRSIDTILATGRLTGRSILDVGCGDGFYTRRFWDLAKPGAVIGIDPAVNAIGVANANKGDRPIEFRVASAHELPFADNSFDLVLLQSILHHDGRPWNVIKEAFRVGAEILIHEPNGNNPGLKIIEKLSPYHIEHEEKSYRSGQLARWISESGGEITFKRFAGFVPMFCPPWMARTMKKLEPIVEGVPVLNALGCSVVVISARRKS